MTRPAPRINYDQSELAGFRDWLGWIENRARARVCPQPPGHFPTPPNLVPLVTRSRSKQSLVPPVLAASAHFVRSPNSFIDRISAGILFFTSLSPFLSPVRRVPAPTGQPHSRRRIRFVFWRRRKIGAQNNVHQQQQRHHYHGHNRCILPLPPRLRMRCYRSSYSLAYFSFFSREHVHACIVVGG